MSASRTFPTTISELPAILAWVRRHLNETNLHGPEKMRLELAMEEAIVNVIRHSGASELKLEARHTPKREISFDLIDFGVEFNPLAHPVPEANDSLEEHPEGGKGLILMKKCSDALLYHREAEKNILTITKKISEKNT